MLITVSLPPQEGLSLGPCHPALSLLKMRLQTYKVPSPLTWRNDGLGRTGNVGHHAYQLSRGWPRLDVESSHHDVPGCTWHRRLGVIMIRKHQQSEHLDMLLPTFWLYMSCFGLQYNAGELRVSPVSQHERYEHDMMLLNECGLAPSGLDDTGLEPARCNGTSDESRLFARRASSVWCSEVVQSHNRQLSQPGLSFHLGKFSG